MNISKKHLKSDFHVVLAASFTAEPILSALKFWSRYLDFSSEIKFAPYAQISQQLLNPESLFYQNTSGANVILFRIEDWMRYQHNPNKKYLSQQLKLFISAIVKFTENGSAPLMVILCPSQNKLARSLEKEVTKKLQSFSQLIFISPADIEKYFSIKKIWNSYGDQLGHIPFAEDYFIAIGSVLFRKIISLKRAAYKVIVLDCDETLWVGRCGEDGAMGVKITRPYYALQAFIKCKKQEGFLICLCSKNNEKDVLDTFRAHPNMPLQLKDIVAYEINWRDKSTNIKALAEKLNLSPSSFIFIDDDPVICAGVRQQLPSVLTLQLPTDREKIPDFLNHVWGFDRTKITAEDQKRTQQYKENFAREDYERQATSYRDFIRRLNLKIKRITKPQEFSSRILQLLERTTQFNCTNLQESETALAQRFSAPDTSVMLFQVADRFGDYGLVGLFLLTQKPKGLWVNNFVLSCRALGRSVEYRLLGYLADYATKQKLSTLYFPFIASARNEPAKQFLESLGAEKRKRDACVVYRLTVSAARNLAKNPPIFIAETKAISRETKKPIQKKAKEVLSRTQEVEIALTRNSVKAIHRAMKKIFKQQSKSRSKTIAPRNTLEKIIINLFSDVLGQPINREDNFLSLGGNSIQATQILARIHDVFKISLSFEQFFKMLTPACLAKEISSARYLQQKTLISRRILKKQLASPGQAGLWFIQQLNPQSASYHTPLLLRLKGNIHFASIRYAAEALVQTQAALRANFVAREGSVFQIMRARREITIPMYTFSHLSDAKARVKAKQKITQLIQMPFDLEKDLLVRFYFLKINTQETQLLIVFHHIIVDGQSLQLFIDELGRSYQMNLVGSSNAILPMQTTFLDYLTAVEENKNSLTAPKSRHYWLETLKNTKDFFDSSLRDIPLGEAKRVYFTLPQALTNQLKTFSKRTGYTQFVTLFSAWNILLYRHFLKEDISIGVPVSQRFSQSFEKTIGYFLNTVVFRTLLNKALTVRELLVRVHQNNLSALSHSQYPLEKITAALRQTRESSLFQIMFVWQESVLEGFASEDSLKITAEELAPTHAKYPLLISLQQAKNQMVGHIEYAAGYFDRTTIQNFVSHYQYLLRMIIKNTNQSISTLSMMDATERQKISCYSKGSSALYPRNKKTVTALFEGVAKKYPHHIACVLNKEKITYDTLNRKANQLARALQKAGVRKGIGVALYLERSIDQIISLLAILKCGAYYLPLSPLYPTDYLNQLSVQAHFVLTQQKEAGKFSSAQNRILLLEHLKAQMEPFAFSNLSLSMRAKDFAYLIFTSGSTGVPKGVPLNHATLLNLILWQNKQSGSRGKATLQFTDLNFDVSFQEIFSTLSLGQTLVLMSKEMRKDVSGWLSVISENHVTRIFLPFAALQQLVDYACQTNQYPRALKEVITAGEQLMITDKVKQFFSNLPKSQLINQYGPSETHVVTAYPLSRDIRAWPEFPPIGQPIAGQAVYILDEKKKVVPLNTPGEIYLYSPFLSPGYFKQPALTQHAFLKIFIPGQGLVRLYKTGDQAKFLPNGQIQFLGRLDNQVKIGGYRIELSQIESVLMKHPFIQQAVVTIQSYAVAQYLLVAYIVKKKARTLTAKDIRAYLQKQLPRYMVPRAIVFLNQFPLLPSGKINRKGLPKVQRKDFLLTRTYHAAVTKNEKKLMAIWKRILSLKEIGIADNFFELGGSSLLAVRILQDINKTFGASILLCQFLKNPTIQSVAQLLDEKSQAKCTL